MEELKTVRWYVRSGEDYLKIMTESEDKLIAYYDVKKSSLDYNELLSIVEGMVDTHNRLYRRSII